MPQFDKVVLEPIIAKGGSFHVSMVSPPDCRKRTICACLFVENTPEEAA